MDKIYETLEKFDLPEYREVPDVGLYLDQVVKFINGYLGAFPEMTVTASMLTKYVKRKVVTRSGKKTYDRSQIAAFLFVAMSKTVLSMDNIRTALARVQEDGPDGQAGSEGQFYSDFREKMLGVLRALSREDGHLARDGSVLTSICTAIGHKMYLERVFSRLREDA